MKEVKDILLEMEDEIEASCHYINQALKYKPQDRELADMYARLASEELGHYNVLTKMVENKAEKVKHNHQEIPEGMQNL